MNPLPALEAIPRLVAAGISVGVTLPVSTARHEAAIGADADGRGRALAR